MLGFGWDCPFSAPEDGDRSPRAEVFTAATQGITVEHLLDSQHARQALETLLTAKQCEVGRNIVESAEEKRDRQDAEEEGRARSVSGAICRLAEAPGQVSAASGSLWHS